MAESVNTAGASAPAPLCSLCSLRPASIHLHDGSLVCLVCFSTVVTPDTDLPNGCQWCGSEDDVRPLRGEHLCIECRTVVAFNEIVSGVEP